MVPKLRFKEFCGEWEEKRLGEICKMFSGGTPTSGKSEYYGGNINFIRSGEIHTNNTELTLTKLGLESSSAKLVKIGDILYALYGATSGEVDISKINGAINQAILCIRPNTDYNKKYLVEVLNFKKMNILNTYLQGGQGNLSGEIIKGLKLKFPSLLEQTKIADFLLILDDKIQNQQDKITHLENIKKGFMQKIFSRRIKFKDDGGEEFPEWEEKKLGDFLIKYDEITVKNNQYPPLTSSRKGIFLQKDYFNNRQIASEDNTGYNIVPFGYFTYRHMSDDAVFYFNINDLVEYGIVSTLYPVFTTTKKMNSIFLQYYLNESTTFKKYCILQKQGGSRTYMYFNKLKQFIMEIPCLKEQQKIADFLSLFDEKISTEKETLEHLKQLKKGLLQQMFV